MSSLSRKPLTNSHPVLLLALGICLSISQLRSQTYARNGMVVCANKVASEVGANTLKAGGNAIDAAVATAFALAVVHPTAGNIGGGGFMVYMPASGDVTTIDFREKAPFAASEEMFLDETGTLQKGANHRGLLSVGVPGTVAGLFLAHKKYGSLPWSALVQPAIELATGTPFPWGVYKDAMKIAKWPIDSVDFVTKMFRKSDGTLLQPGDNWTQPELKSTLQMIRDHGQAGFYSGPVAEEIERYMQANGGVITQRDLAEYEAIERTPVKGTFMGYDIYGMPPPSSGGVALIEMLNILEAARIDTIEFNSVAYVHLVAETMRRAFADRALHLGDPDFNPGMPIDKLLSKEFAQKRLETIGFTTASVSDSVRFGHPYDGANTTHLSVVDKEGAAVSLSYTLEHSYGSGMGSQKLGFIFNNEMGDFNPKRGYTSTIGHIGTPPNLIAPEKRMLSSMTPTIVAKAGQPYLVIGSPGGRTIINTVFQTVLAVLAYEMPVDEAIEAMKIHHQWMPDIMKYEANKLSPDTRAALEQMGHNTQAVHYLGRLMGIQYSEALKAWVGAADSSAPEGDASGH